MEFGGRTRAAATAGTRKGKVVWPGGSRRRPTGDRCSLCRTGEDGKVKYGRDA